MTYRRDIVTGITAMAFAVFYFINSFSIHVFEGGGKSIINSTSLPKLWGVLLFILGTIILLKGMKNKKIEGANNNIFREKMNLKNIISKNYPILGTFLFLGIYILLLAPVGFLIMTPIYLFFQILIITKPKERRYIFTAVLSIVSTISIYLIFVKALYIMLPGGLLPL